MTDPWKLQQDKLERVHEELKRKVEDLTCHPKKRQVLTSLLHSMQMLGITNISKHGNGGAPQILNEVCDIINTRDLTEEAKRFVYSRLLLHLLRLDLEDAQKELLRSLTTT